MMLFERKHNVKSTVYSYRRVRFNGVRKSLVEMNTKHVRVERVNRDPVAAGCRPRNRRRHAPHNDITIDTVERAERD